MDGYGIGFQICPDFSTRFQETDQDNLYYWRDKTGNELDLLLDDATRPTAIKIKAGATINNDYFKGLLYFKNISKDEKLKDLFEKLSIFTN